MRELPTWRRQNDKFRETTGTVDDEDEGEHFRHSTVGLRRSFADLAVTLADIFAIRGDDPIRRNGISFWDEIAPASAA